MHLDIVSVGMPNHLTKECKDEAIANDRLLLSAILSLTVSSLYAVEQSPLLTAMKTELDRSVKALGHADSVPMYFLSYEVTDTDSGTSAPHTVRLTRMITRAAVFSTLTCAAAIIDSTTLARFAAVTIWRFLQRNRYNVAVAG